MPSSSAGVNLDGGLRPEEARLVWEKPGIRTIPGTASASSPRGAKPAPTRGPRNHRACTANKKMPQPRPLSHWPSGRWWLTIRAQQRLGWDDCGRHEHRFAAARGRARALARLWSTTAEGWRTEADSAAGFGMAGTASWLITPPMRRPRPCLAPPCPALRKVCGSLLGRGP